MADIVERLRAHKADIWNWNGAAMTAWDSWRAAIASGDKSSWPRDAFESLIGAYGEDMGEAADEIDRLRAEVAQLTTQWAKDNWLLAEITRLTAEVERMREALNADDQTLRLHLGEMTAQEMRTLRAGFSWVLARAALKPEQEPRT